MAHTLSTLELPTFLEAVRVADRLFRMSCQQRTHQACSPARLGSIR